MVVVRHYARLSSIHMVIYHHGDHPHHHRVGSTSDAVGQGKITDAWIGPRSLIGRAQ
jgi:hypothetical protein